jgi:hypothetical protein
MLTRLQFTDNLMLTTATQLFAIAENSRLLLSLSNCGPPNQMVGLVEQVGSSYVNPPRVLLGVVTHF